MKKITDLLKPNILIIFGALLLIYYLNYLSYGGAGLALGIVAIILSFYYLGVSVLSIFMGNNLSESFHKLIETLSVVLFALFMFVEFLITTINLASIMGPTAWVIKIISMVASLALAGCYFMFKFMNMTNLLRLVYLVSLIFVLALLLDILFDSVGDSRVLGNIDVLLVVIYAAFSFYLFGTFGKMDGHGDAGSDE